MKKTTLISICALLTVCALSQSRFEDSMSSSRTGLTRNAMITLGGWALANIGTGFIVASETQGETKYFWLMNAYWNFINLGLAVPGYLGTIRSVSHRIGFAENAQSQLAIEKLYLFNGGLDLAYIAGGLYLGERGKNEKNLTKREQQSGYGNSIVAQGIFLLLMDGVMYTLHHQNTRSLFNHLRKMEITAGPAGLGLQYKF